MSEQSGGVGGGGTALETLKLGLDVTDVEKGIPALDNFGTATIRTVKHLDDLDAAAKKNTQWINDSNKAYENKIQALERAWKAEQDLLKAQQQATKVIEGQTSAATAFLAKLQETVNTYGMARTELLKYQAAQLGVTNAASQNIADLDRMQKASAKYGVAIKEVGEIEKARIQWEQSAITSLNAQRTREMGENRKRAAQTLSDQEAARTTLNAQRVRSLNDAAAAERAHEEKLKSAATSFQAFKIRTMNENRAAAKRILDEQAAHAAKVAEKQALDEIRWAELSLKARLTTLEKLAAQQANPAISKATIDSQFSSAAQRDLANYNKLMGEYHKTAAGIAEMHRNGHGPAEKLSDLMKQITFNTSRARSELIVLGHEAYQGNWSRFPGSMMVMAEYTNAGAMLFSAMGASILGVGAALAVLSVGMAKGILQQHEMNNALNRTNASSGATINTLTALAMEAGSIYGNMGEAYEATTKLAATGLYTAEQIGQISKAAASVAHVFRVDVNTTIQEFEALVVKGTKVGAVATYGVTRAVQLLDEKYHFLTVTQMAHIVQLEREGKQREASAEAIRLYAEEGEKAAKRSKEYTGNIQTAWHNITGAIDTAIQRVKDWGAVETDAHKLRDVNEKIRNTYDRPSGNSASGDKARAALIEERKAIEERIRLQEIAGKKKVEQNRKDADAKRDLGTMAIEDVRLMRKSTSELERALAEHRERVKTIEIATPGFFSSPEKQKYLAEREANIIREHTRKTATAKNDGRSSDLAAQIDHIQKTFELTERAADAEIKSITKLQKAGSIGQEEAFRRKIEQYDRELAALDDAEKEKLAIIEKYQPRNKKDAASVGNKAQKIRDEAAAARQALELARGADEERYSGVMADKWIDGIRKSSKAEVEGIEKATEAQLKRNSEIGRTKEYIDQMQAANEAGAASQLEVQLEAIAMTQKQFAGLVQLGVITQENADRTSRAYEAESSRIKEILAARQALQKANEQGAELERMYAMQKAYDKSWEKSYKTIEEGIYSAIGDGGDKSLKKLLRDFKAQFAKMVLQPIVAPIANSLASMFNPLATQAGGTASGVAGGNSSTGVQGYVGMAQSAANAYKLASTGFAGVGSSAAGMLGTGIESVGTFFGSSGMASYGAGMGSAAAGSGNAAMYASAQASGNLAPGAAAGAQAGGLVASAATVAAGILAGHFGGRALSAGYSAFGGSGNSAVNTGTAVGTGVGALVGGPLGAAIGAALGGVVGGAVNRLFGYKEREIGSVGMRGEIGVNNAVGHTYTDWKEKGGVFRSDKKGTDIAALDASFINSMKSSTDQMKAITAGFGKDLGLDGSLLNDYNKKFDIDYTKSATRSEEDVKKLIKDKGQAEATKILAEEALEQLFKDIGNELATKVLPDVSKFKVQGESASDTLERLSKSFTLTNDIATQLGKTSEQMFGGKGMESWAARDQLINKAGGVDKLSSLSTSYATNYLSESEKLAPVTKAVAAAMSEMGYASVDTRAEFKATVDSLDVTTAAGADTFLALMNVADAFALVHEEADKTTLTIKEIATQRKELQDAIDELVMKPDELIAKERKNDIDPSNYDLFDKLKAEEKAKTLADERKELQGELNELTLTEVQLNKIKRETLGESNRALFDEIALAKRAKDIKDEAKELQSEYDELAMTTIQLREKERNALFEVNRPLYDQIKLLEDQKKALEDANEVSDGLMTSMDDALAVLEKVIGREKDRLQDANEAEMKALDLRIDKSKDAAEKSRKMADSLQGALDNMKNPLETNDSFMSALSDLSVMLAKARVAGTDALDQKSLERALAGVGNQRAQSYSSQEAYMRDFFKARNTVSNLNGIANAKATAEERTLKLLEEQKKTSQAAFEKEIERLDQMLETNRELVEEAKGQSTSMLSIEQSLQKLLSAVAAVKGDSNIQASQAITGAYESALGRAPDKDGLEYWKGAVANGQSIGNVTNAIESSKEAQVRKLYREIFDRAPDAAGLKYWVTSNASIEQIRGSMQGSKEYKDLPKFDVGTNYVTEDTPAIVHEGERIMPKADNTALMSALRNPQSNNEAMISEFKAMRKELQGLRSEQKAGHIAIQRDTAEMASKLKRFEGQGMPIRDAAPTN